MIEDSLEEKMRFLFLGGVYLYRIAQFFFFGCMVISVINIHLYVQKKNEKMMKKIYILSTVFGVQ